MYELVFTIVMLVDGRVGLNQTTLEKFDTEQSCKAMLVLAHQELLKTAAASKTVPGILVCRQSI